MAVLTSGLFDRLKFDFLSIVQARQGPNTIRRFYERLLTHERQFCRLENSEAILAGNAISLNIMAFEREPNCSEIAFF